MKCRLGFLTHSKTTQAPNPKEELAIGRSTPAPLKQAPVYRPTIPILAISAVYRSYPTILASSLVLYLVRYQSISSFLSKREAKQLLVPLVVRGRNKFINVLLLM